MSLVRNVFDLVPPGTGERSRRPGAGAGLAGHTAQWLRGRRLVGAPTGALQRNASAARSDMRQAAQESFMRAESHSAAPLVSVVIPTRNRPEALERCLLALLGQTGVHGPIEIIIVDDARSARQEAALLGYMRGASVIAVRYLHTAGKRQGAAAARNTGWRAARGGIIAFADDDSLPERHWLREGLRAMRPGVDAVWGPLLAPKLRRGDCLRQAAAQHSNAFHIANSFIRREALERIGGFDERFTRPRQADPDVYFSLSAADCHLCQAAAACVRHPAANAAPSSSLQGLRELMFDALLQRKHQSRAVTARLSWRYYASVLALLVLAVALFGGQALVAAIAALGWLALSSQLAIQALRTAEPGALNALHAVLRAAFIPVVAVFWRIAGAVRYRVPIV